MTTSGSVADSSAAPPVSTVPVPRVFVETTPFLSSSVVGPPAAPARLFTNPVVTTDFPDPSLLRVGDTFYLYGTRTRGVNLQVQSSPNLVDWTAHPDPLPVLGSWALPNKTWAPEVTQVGDQSVMFYTAWDAASGRQCIGRAVAAHPVGPFVDDSAAPFLCQLDLGGSIDANPVVAPDGARFLYWKSDGNCCGVPVGLWGQAMNATADALVGEPVNLLTNTLPWQGPLIEGPEMVIHNGGHFLFYAGNSYNTAAYAEGFARCDGPLGPCVDAVQPMLTSNADGVGPGHGFVFGVGDQWWIVYHAYRPDSVGLAQPGRLVWLDPLTWTPDGPVATSPNGNPQPAPVL